MDSVRVLLVEDDEDDFIITRDLLAESGQIHYQLDWVISGEHALDRLQKTQPPYDICLMDYRLGNQTGFDIMRAAKSSGVGVPMILLTEHSDRELDLLAMQEGASDFLVKSEINSVNLDRVIRYVWAVKQHERERIALALAIEESKQSEKAHQIKDDFLAMVSHELRGPINAMLLWLSLLKAPDLDAETLKSGVDTIERSLKQQSKILDDLLELTRSRNNMIRLDKQAVDLTALLYEVMITQQPVAGKKNIYLSFHAPAEAITMMADIGRLKQIFNNLLDNSIKFTPESGKINLVLSQYRNDDQGYVQVVIQDSGKGIAPEILPYVFDRYLQAPTCSYSRNSGLGLGLTITRQLVELHGGSISVESLGDDQGATFYIQLPTDME